MATGFEPPSPQAVDAAMELLPRVPKTWGGVPELSDLESQGLGLLVAGGLVERKLPMRLRSVGDERVVAISFRFTGQAGLAQAMEPGLAEAWDLWEKAWKEGKKTYVESPGDAGEWRLTADGQGAARQLAEGKVRYLYDFLRTPGVPDMEGKPPDRQFVPGIARRVVAGEGHVERLEVVNAGSGPLSVRVENLAEVSAPLGDIARAVQSALDHLVRSQQQGEQPPKGGGRRGPSPLPFDEARRYVELLRRWADVQQENQHKTRKEQTTKYRFAQANKTTKPELKAAQSWYRNHRHSHGLPADPRNLTDEELRKHFPKRG